MSTDNEHNVQLLLFFFIFFFHLLSLLCRFCSRTALSSVTQMRWALVTVIFVLLINVSLPTHLHALTKWEHENCSLWVSEWALSFGIVAQQKNQRKNKLKMWLLFAHRFLFICIILHFECLCFRATHTHTQQATTTMQLIWAKKAPGYSDGTFSCSIHNWFSVSCAAF